LEQQRKPILSIPGVLVQPSRFKSVQTLPELRLSGKEAPVDRTSVDADRTQRKRADRSSMPPPLERMFAWAICIIPH
jgi:hypothetical protein